MQRLPGRAVSQVDVIKHDDERRTLAHGGQHVGKCSEHANARGATRASVTDRGAYGRKDHRKVMGRRASHRDDVLAVQRAQVPFKCFDPEAEPCGGAHRVRARRQRDNVVPPGRYFSSQPRLPHARIAKQQHGTQLALLHCVEGFIEEKDVLLSAHQRQALRNTAAGGGASAGARCRSGHIAPHGIIRPGCIGLSGWREIRGQQP